MICLWAVFLSKNRKWRDFGAARSAAKKVCSNLNTWQNFWRCPSCTRTPPRAPTKIGRDWPEKLQISEDLMWSCFFFSLSSAKKYPGWLDYKGLYYTLPPSYLDDNKPLWLYHPRSLTHSSWKTMGLEDDPASFWEGLFLGAILNFHGVRDP